jgi:hypothetical protein
MSVDIKISSRKDGPELVIRDNAGGVPQDQAPILFALGRNAQKTGGGSIGTYGLGAKKALVNLGLPCTVASWDIDEEIGWEYTITREWLDDDATWEVPVTESDELEPGVTELRIETLNYDWSSERSKSVRSSLEETYNFVLEDTTSAITNNLRIVLDGQELEPQGAPDWSYSPFDGIQPRRFENITLDIESADYPINLDVTVGLLRKKDSKESGTDIYCQNRKVVSADRGAVGGFGSGRDKLGPFNVHHERLKIIVELYTEGDASKLPWDTQKANINRHTEVMKKVRGWLTSTASPYYDLPAPVVPRSFVEFYPADAEHAANGGELEVEDYGNKMALASPHKPDRGLSDIAALQQRCKAHTTLRFRCEDGLVSWMVPAYRNQLEAELPSELSYDDLPRLEGSDPLSGLDETSATESKEAINTLARKHSREGMRYAANLQPWQVPVYQRYFDMNVDKALRTPRATPTEVPTTPSEAVGTDPKSGGSSETGDESGPPNDDVPEAEIAIAMVVDDGESEQITSVFRQDQVELNEALGLSRDSSQDELHSEISRRFELMVKFNAGIPGDADPVKN